MILEQLKRSCHKVVSDTGKGKSKNERGHCSIGEPLIWKIQIPHSTAVYIIINNISPILTIKHTKTNLV